MLPPQRRQLPEQPQPRVPLLVLQPELQVLHQPQPQAPVLVPPVEQAHQQVAAHQVLLLAQLVQARLVMHQAAKARETLAK